MADGPLIAARDLVVRYRSVEAVRGVSLAVHRGEVVGLIGPDGAGKTSTLRVLAGLLRATGGQAEALGVDCWSSRRALHRRLGYLAQRFALYGDLTVDENVQFFALMYGVHDWRQRRRELLGLVGLDRFSDRLADRLSGRMKQKLFTGVHGNYLKGSIVAAGMDPDNLPESDKSKMDFGSGSARPRRGRTSGDPGKASAR